MDEHTYIRASIRARKFLLPAASMYWGPCCQQVAGCTSTYGSLRSSLLRVLLLYSALLCPRVQHRCTGLIYDVYVRFLRVYVYKRARARVYRIYRGRGEGGLAAHMFHVHDVLGIIVSTVVRVLLDQTWMNVVRS